MDALVLGKHTCDKVMSFPEWPYGDKPLTVLSHSLRALPPSLPSSVQLSQESPSALLDRLGDSGIESVYVDGGAVIQSFLRDGLIDELAITTIPVLLGAGIPLFGTLDKDVHLELKSSQVFSCGFVLNRYRVKG